MPRLLSRWFDRPLQQLLSFGLLFCLSAIVVSCSSPIPTSSSPTNPSPAAGVQPVVAKPLNVAVIPWRSPEEQDKKLQVLAEYLKQTIQRTVTFQTTKDYETAVELLVQEKVDMAYLGPLTYIQAHERNANLEPILVPIDATTGRPWYTSVIVADPSKGIQTLQDLKGKRFGFVSPSSTSGFLAPMNAFLTQGINPPQDFERIRYLGSHDKAVTGLTNDEVDAIAIESSAYARAQSEGKLPATSYKVIWESEPIPAGPIVINKSKFTPEETAQLRQALIDAPLGVSGVAVSKLAGYTLAKDGDFEAMRQIYLRVKSTKVAEK